MPSPSGITREQLVPEGIAIFGAGGFGREVAFLAQQRLGEDVKITFIVNRPELVGTTVNEISVMDVEEFALNFPAAPVIVSVGDPKAREACVSICTKAGLKFISLVHPRVEASRWISVGTGSVICAGSILTTNISVGDHVHINLDCTIGHDVVIGDFTTLAPGVHVSGRVTLGRRVYVGTGAVIINGTDDKHLILGDDAVVGAGACVIRDVTAGTLVVGVPAKPKS